ncbi:MAG: adenylate/guanylate cyclase domain-containing protein, partial [Candidatus Eremiobacterota bacterium]
MGQPPSLRRQLILAVVGGVFLLVVSICVVILANMLPTLRQEVRKQVTVDPFVQLQKKEAEGLVDLGQNIALDNNFMDAILKDTAQHLKPVLDGLSAEQLKNPTAQIREALSKQRNLMRNVMDQSQRVWFRGDVEGAEFEAGTEQWEEPKTDLLVMVDPLGQVLFEFRSCSLDSLEDLSRERGTEVDLEHLGQVLVHYPLSDNRFPEPSSLFLGDNSLYYCSLYQGDSFVSYVDYPDGNLYLMAAIPTQHGILLLGHRMDLHAAYAASRSSSSQKSPADAFILAGERFVDGYAPTPHADRPMPAGEVVRLSQFGTRAASTRALGLELAGFVGRSQGRVSWLPQVAAPAREKLEEFCGGAFLTDVERPFEPQSQDLPLAGTRYVVLAYPLDLAPIPGSALNARRRLGPVLGWLFLMKPTSVVDKAATRQALLVCGVGVLGLGLGVFFLRRIALKLTEPILELSRKMQGVGEGTLPETEMEPRGSLEIVQAAQAFNRMVTGLRQKEVLEKFVPLGTREQVARNADVVVGTGRRVHATVLFSDLRGFTALSERLEPAALVSLLSTYLQRMTEAVYAEGGDINEYIGDAILAVFMDGEDGSSSAEKAVRAALAMHRALAQLQAEATNQELQGLKQGIGINTGILVQGFIGSDTVR